MDRSGAVERLRSSVARFAARYPAPQVCVGLSGGPDSLALLAISRQLGIAVEALIVDHQLQEGSAEVARAAAQTAQDLGATAQILAVQVGTAGGPEAAAREVRRAALVSAAAGRPVWLAHTVDDQAETVLLRLARGAGATSLAGMREWSPPFGRPLLTARRADTHAAMTALGLEPFRDPHNADPRYTRVRVRSELLPLLEDMLPGATAALARTADQLAADADYFADLIADPPTRLPLAQAGLAAAVRTRIIKRWLELHAAAETSHTMVMAVDALLRGERRGEVAVGGDSTGRLVAVRDGDALVLRLRPR